MHEAEAHGAQALSAGADAGAAVPLQSRLRRLRQDRLSGPDPQPAPLGAGMPRRGRRMRRADGRDPRRRAADPQGDRRDRQGHRGAQEIRLAVHQRAAAGEEAASVRAVALSVLLGPSRRHQGASRQVGVHGRRLRARGRRRSRPPRPRASPSTSTPRSSTAIRPRTSPSSSISPRSSASASRSRPAMPTSARPTRSTSSTARKTKELFRKVFALGKGKNWKFMHSGMFLDFLAGNQELHCTPWGMPTRNIFGWQKPCYLLGEGYAKTFTELMETTDWDLLRHRPLRKVRELHGALRLRADRRRAMLQQSAQGAQDRAARREDRRPDGAGNLAREPAAGAIRVRQQVQS